MRHVDTVVIGAGIVGLSVARSLALSGREVLVLEAEKSFGTGISSRNSEVIHAGIYYPQNSLKAKLCVIGNRLLRAYAESRHVPFKITGKLIVATSHEEESSLDVIHARAEANGVHDLKRLSKAEVLALEPELSCTSALLSPSTGIIDTHALMLALVGDAEAHGALIAYRTPVLYGEETGDGTKLQLGGQEPFQLTARHVIIAAGLATPRIAKALKLNHIPEGHLCKGSYFALNGRAPFSRLVYPVPVPGGLGVHYTLDLGGMGRFGPDVEWIDEENYHVDPSRREDFARAVQRYWPACTAERLEPAYSGIRPKICAKGEKDQDFSIMGADVHGRAGVVALLGIESPGLTSALALAEVVTQASK